MSGRWVQSAMVALLGVAVLVAYPAPSSIGIPEIVMGLLALGLAVHFFVVRGRFTQLGRNGRLVAWGLGAYLAAWLLGSVLGVLRGAEMMSIVRSLLPQVLFAPVVLVGLSLSDPADGKRLGKILVWIGAIHGLYLLGLGVIAYTGAGSSSELAVNRITFLDTRTTMPLFLALAPFGLAAFVSGRLRNKVAGASGVLLCAAAALATQTRAQILAIVLACLVFGVLAIARNPTPVALASAAVVLVLGAATVAAVPPLRKLALAVVERQEQVGDNARLADEWIPALNQWEARGAAGFWGGIGLGIPIKDFSGEEKTYIHNQSIYTLVYTGVIGLVLVSALYGATAFSLVRRYWATRDTVDLAAASALVGLWTYGQLFAVHKLFSFNLMLFVIVAIAIRPRATGEPGAEPAAVSQGALVAS